MNGKIKYAFCVLLTLLFSSCEKKEKLGQLELKFDFNVDGATFVQDKQIYTNAAGNKYEINEIMFFISDVILTKEDGATYKVKDHNSIHYVDYDLPATLNWKISDQIPVGSYKSLSFVFGFPPEKNKNNYFTDPPESNMFWPATLGGGYHYMKINGKWDSDGISKNLNFHTGIGQIRNEAGEITEYVHNHFTVTLPVHSFIITESTTSVVLNMNLNNWFNTPHIYDFDYWGSSIMQNQTAQEVIRENGADVFTIK
ncbi:MAG: hypothetical protein RR356_03725 [Bacteroidales bacterium]